MGGPRGFFQSRRKVDVSSSCLGNETKSLVNHHPSWTHTSRLSMPMRPCHTHIITPPGEGGQRLPLSRQPRPRGGRVYPSVLSLVHLAPALPEGARRRVHGGLVGEELLVLPARPGREIFALPRPGMRRRCGDPRKSKRGGLLPFRASGLRRS